MEVDKGDVLVFQDPTTTMGEKGKDVLLANLTRLTISSPPKNSLSSHHLVRGLKFLTTIVLMCDLSMIFSIDVIVMSVRNDEKVMQRERFGVESMTSQ